MTPKMRDRGLIALEMRLKGDTYANIGRVLGVSRNHARIISEHGQMAILKLDYSRHTKKRTLDEAVHKDLCNKTPEAVARLLNEIKIAKSTAFRDPESIESLSTTGYFTLRKLGIETKSEAIIYFQSNGLPTKGQIYGFGEVRIKELADWIGVEYVSPDTKNLSNRIRLAKLLLTSNGYNVRKK